MLAQARPHPGYETCRWLASKVVREEGVEKLSAAQAPTGAAAEHSCVDRHFDLRRMTWSRPSFWSTWHAWRPGATRRNRRPGWLYPTAVVGLEFHGRLDPRSTIDQNRDLGVHVYLRRRRRCSCCPSWWRCLREILKPLVNNVALVTCSVVPGNPSPAHDLSIMV